jgi:hypothetical protein
MKSTLTELKATIDRCEKIAATFRDIKRELDKLPSSPSVHELRRQNKHCIATAEKNLAIAREALAHERRNSAVIAPRRTALE